MEVCLPYTAYSTVEKKVPRSTQRAENCGFKFGPPPLVLMLTFQPPLVPTYLLVLGSQLRC